MAKFVRQPPGSMDDASLVFGGEVDEYHFSLRFFGDDLDPDELTRLLGAKPTYSCRKGDIFKGKKSDRVEKTGKWHLSLPTAPGASFDPQIIGLFAGLSPDLQLWRELSAKYSGDVFCGVWIRKDNRMMGLSPEIMTLFVERGLELGLDIYYDPPEENIVMVVDTPSTTQH